MAKKSSILSFLHKKKLGLALGGGAARGQAHIGVLKVLQKYDVPIHFVAGTSVGSIIGALYCSGYTWKEIEKITREMKWNDLAAPLFPPDMGLLNLEKMEKTLDKLIGSKEFHQMDIPFRAVAADISNGRQIVFDSGKVATAVRASCSIPGIFAPVKYQGSLLIDGGMVNNIPVDIIKDMGADLTIGVDLNADRVRNKNPQNIFDVLFYTFNILISQTSRSQMEKVDLIVSPDLAPYNYHDLDHLDELIEAGVVAMEKEIDKLQKMM